jgi:hypothetical protein
MAKSRGSTALQVHSGGRGRRLNPRVFLDAVQEDVAMSGQQQKPADGREP